MTGTYKATLYVWPYSGVKREPAPYTTGEPNRGAKEPVIKVKAADFDDALKQVRLILIGIKLDERVWEAGIRSLELDR